MEKISLSPIVAISEDVNKKSSETGKDFILFQRGEIGFSTPQYIVDAMFNIKYAKSVAKDLNRIDIKSHEKIKKSIECLRNFPDI